MLMQKKLNVIKYIIIIFLWDTDGKNYLYIPADPSQVESKTLKSNSIGQVMVGSNTTAHISNPSVSLTR